MVKNWHQNAFFGLHFDIHACESDTGLGRDLSVEHLVRQLEKIKPDYVQCDCKGHPGYASYPTRSGIAAPNIVKDSVKIWREATKELGIPLVMHYSGIWDAAVLSIHPEWSRINPPGSKGSDLIETAYDGYYPDNKMTCPLSAYTDDYMSRQLIEIIDWYDVDGFWIDGENWAVAPCYCEKCKDKFTKQTGLKNIPVEKGGDNWDIWLQYSRQNFEDHVRRFTEAVHLRKPECTVCSNWMYTVRQPDEVKVSVDYLSGDFDYIWSAQRANAEARFMSGKAMSWDLMAWGFTSYGPMKSWTFKSIPAMCQEASIVISCGGGIMLYDQPNRTGNLVEWHMDKISEVARFCRARQEYCQHTKSIPQVAVLHNKDHFYSNNEPLYNLNGAEKQMEGALHAFLDNQFHVDIFTDSDLMEHMAAYKLCVVAEQDNLSEKMVRHLKEYVYNGGNLIVSGAEHTRRFDDIAGVEDLNILTGEDLGQRLYIPDHDETVAAIGNWRLVKKNNAMEVEPLLFERNLGIWEQNSGSPAAVINTYGKGKIAAVYGPVFGAYYDSHYPGIRHFIKKLVSRMEIQGLALVEAPVCINFVFRKKNNRLLLNFLNQGSDKALSPRNAYIENVPEAGPVKVKLHLENRPRAVFIAPGEMPVQWTYEKGIFQAEIKKIGIHDILVIE